MRIVNQTLLFATCIADSLVTLGWAVLLWPLSRLDRWLHYTILTRMCTFIGDQLAFWIPVSGHQCFEVGEDVSSCYGQNCLVIANHQSTLDPCVLAMSFRVKGIFERTMWIMDDWIRYTPFGVCAWLRGDFFILQGKDKKELQQAQLQHSLLNEPIGSDRRWVSLYPEGGLLRRRKFDSQRYAKAHSLPVFQHVCLPRTGAFETVLSTLHPRNTTLPNAENGIACQQPKLLKWIVDVTLGYKPNADMPSFETLGMFSRKPCTVVLHYRMFPIEEVPTDPEGQKKWLYRRFEEKEDLLRIFHETGAFPERLHTRNRLLDSPVPIECGIWMPTSAFVFLAASMVFQYWILKWLVTLWTQ